jgi:hypothetical protein
MAGSSIRPPEDAIRRLVAEWLSKADLDHRTAARLRAEDEFRDIVAFHAQQAVEKYLKALLTFHQIEFPKTHVIRRLLILLEPVQPSLVAALDDANWLTPFGSEIPSGRSGRGSPRRRGESLRAGRRGPGCRDGRLATMA